MTAMLLRLQPYYTVRPGAEGRWLVVHALPGQPGAQGLQQRACGMQQGRCRLHPAR